MNIDARKQHYLAIVASNSDRAVVHDDDLFSELGIDSLGAIDMVMALQETLQIDIPDALLDEDTFHSVGGFWAALQPLLPRAMEPACP